MTSEKASSLRERCLNFAHILLLVQGAWLTARPLPGAAFMDAFLEKGWTNLVQSWMLLAIASHLLFLRMTRREGGALFVAACFLAFSCSLRAWSLGLPHRPPISEVLLLSALLVTVLLGVWFKHAARGAATLVARD